MKKIYEFIFDFVCDFLPWIVVAVAVLTLFGGIILPIFIACAKDLWAWALA